MTAPTAQPPDLRAEIKALIEQEGLSQRLIARESGIGDAVLNQWLANKYPGDNATVVSKLERWRDAYQRRRVARASLADIPGYLPTPTGEKIQTALSYAQLAGDIALIYGAAGLGKTRAAERYAALNPNVWLATLSPATASVSTALGDICLALGLRELPQGSARLYQAAIHRVKDTAGLLILDEAQHLSVNALDQVRSLHDATGIGIALIGNETVYARLTGGSRAAYLDRLHSRVGKRLALTRPLKGDVEALAAAWSLTGNAELTLLRDIARQSGALRLINKTLRLATVFAAGGPLTLDPIKLAWADLTGNA